MSEFFLREEPYKETFTLYNIESREGDEKNRIYIKYHTHTHSKNNRKLLKRKKQALLRIENNKRVYSKNIKLKIANNVFRLKIK